MYIVVFFVHHIRDHKPVWVWCKGRTCTCTTVIHHCECEVEVAAMMTCDVLMWLCCFKSYSLVHRPETLLAEPVFTSMDTDYFVCKVCVNVCVCVEQNKRMWFCCRYAETCWWYCWWCGLLQHFTWPWSGQVQEKTGLAVVDSLVQVHSCCFSSPYITLSKSVPSMVSSWLQVFDSVYSLPSKILRHSLSLLVPFPRIYAKFPFSCRCLGTDWTSHLFYLYFEHPIPIHYTKIQCLFTSLRMARVFLVICARLNWQLACQFFSANHLSYIVSYGCSAGCYQPLNRTIIPFQLSCIADRWITATRTAIVTTKVLATAEAYHFSLCSFVNFGWCYPKIQSICLAFWNTQQFLQHNSFTSLSRCHDYFV